MIKMDYNINPGIKQYNKPCPDIKMAILKNICQICSLIWYYINILFHSFQLVKCFTNAGQTTMR